MKINTHNYFGKSTRVNPRLSGLSFDGVRLHQGSQILRTPPYSVLKDIVLSGGASYRSKWAVLRGAVIKFDPKRNNSLYVNGKGLIIPTGFTLMDFGSLDYTIRIKNKGKAVPYSIFDHTSTEPLYLVPASYCHPDELFLPQGSYTNAQFSEKRISVEHMKFEKRKLYLKESELPVILAPFNVLEEINAKPDVIVVELIGGGHIELRDL